MCLLVPLGLFQVFSWVFWDVNGFWHKTCFEQSTLPKQSLSWLKSVKLMGSFFSPFMITYTSNRRLASSPTADQSSGEYTALIVSFKPFSDSVTHIFWLLAFALEKVLTSSSHDCKSCSDFFRAYFHTDKQSTQCMKPALQLASLAMQGSSVIMTESSLADLPVTVLASFV